MLLETGRGTEHVCLTSSVHIPTSRQRLKRKLLLFHHVMGTNGHVPKIPSGVAPAEGLQILEKHH